MSANILVTGATGNLGKHLCVLLEAAGLEYITTTRNKSMANDKQVFLDLKTGEGIIEACQNKKTIFHLASGTKKANRQTEVDSVKQFMDVAKKNGLEHFIFISIVGIEKVPVKYYKYKVEAENIIKDSGVPYTILRATQFHEFIENMLNGFLKYKIGFLPLKGKNQPVETKLVAQKLLDIYKAGPVNGTVELGGPEVLTFKEMATAWQAYTGKKKIIIPVPPMGKALSAINSGALTNGILTKGSYTWEQYLKQKHAS